MGLEHDLLGKTFGCLTAKWFWKSNSYRRIWKCVCRCGSICYIKEDGLLDHYATDCGCGISSNLPLTTYKISYQPLFDIMKKKRISQASICRNYNIASSQLQRMKHNMYCSTHTLQTLCNILDCDMEDVVTIVPDYLGKEYYL